MINIGIIRFNNGTYGGIEHQIINIISNIDKEHFKFILITDNATAFSKEFEKYGNVYYINHKNIIKASRQVKKIVEENNISIIQSHMLREHYIGCLTKLRKKNIYHIFRVHTYINCSFISNWRKKLYHILSFLLDYKVDLYLPINENNYKELIENTKINKAKAEVVHDGVRGLAPSEIKHEFNYEKLAMIANFQYGKGHDIALRALQILVKENPNYHLLFIGHGVEQENDVIINQVKEIAKELKVEKNIEFFGFSDNLGKAIENIDIIILPSYSEGTPNCLLEAMSLKKIVIASKVGGIPEFITDEVNGYLHENKDYETLANKILNLKNIGDDKIKKIGEEGYKTWREEYSIKRLCSYLEKLYASKGENV